jgi:hypothetical protein
MMRQFILGLLISMSIFQSNALIAQCPGCSIISTCNLSKPNGGLCRGDMTGMVSKPYSKDITFYMPKKIKCSDIGMGSQCTYVDLKVINIASITSPPGLSSQTNKLTYNVASNDTLGCLKVCGTPLSASTYLVVVNLLADIKAYGTAGGDVDLNGQTFTYSDTIVILADTTKDPALSSFSFVENNIRKSVSAIKKCDNVTVDSFMATINGSCNLASYKWSFDSTSFSSFKKPANKITFSTPDTVLVKLTTQLYNFRIKNVLIGSINSNYSDGALKFAAMEEITGNPDPFITINIGGFNNRRNCGSTACGSNQDIKTNIAFNNLNIVIPAGSCDSSIKLGIFDEDSAPIGVVLTGTGAAFASNDDLLDNMTFLPMIGTTASKNGANTSNVRIVFDTVPDGPPIVETLKIIVYPTIAQTTILSPQDTACVGTQLMMHIPSTTNYIEWFKDTTLLVAQNKDTLKVMTAGNYKARLSSSLGCKSTSLPHMINYLAAADAQIYKDAGVIYIVAFNPTAFTYEWYKDSVKMVGKDNLAALVPTETGWYKLKQYNKYCYSYSTEMYYYVKPNSIDEVKSNIKIYPNPFENELHIESAESHDITIFNALGVKVMDKKSIANQNISLEGMPSGLYSVETISSSGQKNILKFVKK